jgi:hypothetical protein
MTRGWATLAGIVMLDSALVHAGEPALDAGRLRDQVRATVEADSAVFQQDLQPTAPAAPAAIPQLGSEPAAPGPAPASAASDEEVLRQRLETQLNERDDGLSPAELAEAVQTTRVLERTTHYGMGYESRMQMGGGAGAGRRGAGGPGAAAGGRR